MPFVLPLAGLIGAAIGGTELGMQVAGVGQPSPHEMEAQQQKMLDQAKMETAQKDAEAKRKAILASLSNAQEQGGGSLDEKGLTSLASIIAGLPGEATTNVGGRALSDYLGLGAPTAPGATGAPPETMVGATYGLSGTQG